MKFATISTLLALFAATQACGIVACTGSGGSGICTKINDQEDEGCHSPGNIDIKSYVWHGDDCGGSSKKICAWQTDVCNGSKGHVRNVNDVPFNRVHNVDGGRRSFKFMNNGFFC